MDHEHAKELCIQKYFAEGYTCLEILDFLSKRHDISMSLSTLKRILKNLDLRRKNIPESDLRDICGAIIDELIGSGCSVGYKTLWRRLKFIYGLKIKRQTVLKILREVDPDGIKRRAQGRFRRRKYNVPGPNFLWHIDGYDKLKPFGFAIHGCIDGFSRKILWLEVATSNNKPEIIAYYFLYTVNKLQLLPTLLRSDHGTENTVVEGLQQSLRFHHNDKLAGSKSFIKGKSTSNQRIESYWSQLRRHGLDFWISFFKDMRDKDLYNDSNDLHVECLRYVFGPLIKLELDIIRHEWNRHRIRKQKNVQIPSGKPNYLFYMPEKVQSKNYKKPIDQDSLGIAQNHYTIQPLLYTPDFDPLVETLFSGKVRPYNVEDALKFYVEILELIETCRN